MPIYEYQCEKCGEIFEVWQSHTSKVLDRHNHQSDCGGKVRKLISPNTFHLKGGGWFKDGYSNVKDDKKEKQASKKAALPKSSESKATTSPAD